jgi:hypothetical protein
MEHGFFKEAVGVGKRQVRFIFDKYPVAKGYTRWRAVLGAE